jgi:hypothetical protein
MQQNSLGRRRNVNWCEFDRFRNRRNYGDDVCRFAGKIRERWQAISKGKLKARLMASNCRLT